VPVRLPTLCTLRSGKFLVMQYPIFATALAPVSAVARIYFTVPFLGLMVFFALYLGVVNNQNLDRGVRFNALQAVLLDILIMCASLLLPFAHVSPSRCAR
jgi:Chloroplast import apparatus Tic20-like